MVKNIILIGVINYEQFAQWIGKFGLPNAISFDHDLGKEDIDSENIYQEKTGMDCAKWLVDYCIDNNKELPEIFVHSANPVGADNIKYLFSNFKKHHNEK